MSSMRSLYDAPWFYAQLFGARGEDVAFYTRLARSHTEVLEYGVGAGRVALPTAREGARVVGVDTAPEMLAELAERAAREPLDVRERLSWHCADARTLSLAPRAFSLVTCPFNGLAHLLDRDAQRAFFARVREHMAPGGLFAFDVWLPDLALLGGHTTDGPRFPHPRTGVPTRFHQTFAYEPFTQVLTTTLVLTPVGERVPSEVLTLTQRQFFPEETLALLELHGLEVAWRTSRFALPEDGRFDGPPRDNLAREPDDTRGEMLAYICRAR